MTKTQSLFSIQPRFQSRVYCNCSSPLSVLAKLVQTVWAVCVGGFHCRQMELVAYSWQRLKFYKKNQKSKFWDARQREDVCVYVCAVFIHVCD